MKRIIAALIFFAATPLLAQPTFKAGWDTYKTGTLTHEYTYEYNSKDTLKLYLTDSSQIFTSPDSMVILTVNFPFHEKGTYKTINYLDKKKQLIKKEEYKDENLLVMNEWKYDDKNRKTYHVEENKVNGNNYRHTYEYATDKKTGETVATESSYFNGRIEFYTKAYFDKDNVKYKEVRLNDNNKDVVHIESYTYGENGKVRDRSVFFPEWKVTKTFHEHDGDLLPKCYRVLPMGTAEKVLLQTRIAFIKRLITKNTFLLSDKDCSDYEYIFRNWTNCEIVLSTTKVNNTKKVVFRFKEKMM